MATFEHSAVLQASPDRVYALLERVEDFADYSERVKAVEHVGEDRYRWHISAAGMDWTFVIRITEARAPETLAWESLEGVCNQGRYELTAVPEGTRVKLTVNYQIRNRLLEKTVDRAAGPLARQASRQVMERVKARL